LTEKPSDTPSSALPADLARSITPEALQALPICRYEGPVEVVESAEQLDEAIRDLAAERVVGFDTETRPAFRVGERYLPSLVQFATARAVYLFQVQQRDFSAAIRDVLASQRIVKVGISVTHDLRTLKELFDFDAQGVVDLGRVAKRHGVKQTGVRSLAGLFLDARITKGASTSNWAAAQLTRQQIQYAATDAWVCRELYLRFQALALL
jgi:ribonuclease D